MTNKKEKSKTRDWLKIAISVLAILTGLAYTGNAWFTYSRGIPNQNQNEWEGFRGDRGPRGERPTWPQSDEERQQRFNQIATDLNLTEDQRNQITQIWQGGRPEGPDGWRERADQMRSILTPQQQEQMQRMRQSRGQDFMNRRLEEAKKKLSPNEYKRFEERMKERTNRFRNGGGRGQGGLGGGRRPGGS